MPRSFDRRKQTVSSHDPLRNLLDFESVHDTAKQHGDPIKGLFDQFVKFMGFDGIISFVTGLFGGTLPTPEEVWENVTNLFVKPLGFFAELIGGLISGAVIPILDPTKILNLPELFTKVQATLNSGWTAIMGDDEGAIDRTADEFAQALQNIPGVNVIAQNGANLVDTVTDILDNIWRGLTGQSGSGKSTADVANAATVLSGQADAALQVGEWTYAITQLRNNKSLMEGVDETEEANFPITDPWGIGTEPVAAYAASAAAVPVAYWRAKESAKKGFISWFGKGITDVTGLFIDVYRADRTTDTWELVYTSPDVIGMATANWQYLIHNIADAEDRIDVVAGDVLGVAWRVTGTGTHSIAGMVIAGQPEHPTLHPKRPVSVRTGSGDVSFASTDYSANTVPWFGIGIVTGDVPPPYFAPRETSYTTAGEHTYQIPVSATHLDVVLCGAGGGGQGGSTFSGQHGEGGDAAQWAAETLVRGVDFPADATELTITVGLDGNNGGAGSFAGSAGGDSIRHAITAGKAALIAAGGPGGNNPNEPGASSTGDSPGDFTYLGRTYPGGIGGASWSSRDGFRGGSPGAGGGGGSGGIWGVAWPGGEGGVGMAHVIARQE